MRRTCTFILSDHLSAGIPVGSRPLGSACDTAVTASKVGSYLSLGTGDYYMSRSVQEQTFCAFFSSFSFNSCTAMRMGEKKKEEMEKR